MRGRTVSRPGEVFFFLFLRRWMQTESRWIFGQHDKTARLTGRPIRNLAVRSGEPQSSALTGERRDRQLGQTE